jgi:hypothetical protein
MLKKSASIVLGSSKSSTYPTREKSCSDSSGWVGENRHASGFDSPAALPDGLFEHPGLYSPAIPSLTTSEIAACPPSLPPITSHHVLS